MVANRGEGTIGWQVRRNSNTRLCFTTRGIGTGQDDTASNNDPPLNEWVHIACVYDSVSYTKSIYMDGILDRKLDLTGTNTVIGATTHNTYIGARANNGNTGQENYFTGMLDEVRIYSRALSAGNVVFLADPNP